jgi:tRNA threonylcarbamoyl adenosine modification protein YjeE
MRTFISHSLEDTAKIAADWLSDLSLKYGASDEAVTIGLSGHLGAGKTAFVKEMAKLLGVKEEVTSPTFVIMKIYETTHANWHRLVHIDAYRLEKREELEVLQLENLTADQHNLIMIEWPENAELKDSDLHERLVLEIREGVHSISL